MKVAVVYYLRVTVFWTEFGTWDLPNSKQDHHARCFLLLKKDFISL
jgi:hypothetical protein